MQDLGDENKKLESALYIVSTPIGNMKDMTMRALDVLEYSDCILCENPKNSEKLFNFYEIRPKKIRVYNDFSTDVIRNDIVSFIKDNKSVALITDAGTPLISDPGYKLVKLCRDVHVKTIPIPGCSAMTTALSVSGISTDKFLFYGFLSSNKNHKYKELRELMNRNESVILYESPMRLMDTLEMIREFDSKRIICVAKELTKIHENVITDTAFSLYEYYVNNLDKIKGEFVIVMEKNISVKKIDLDSISNLLEKSLDCMSVKDSSEFFSGLLQNTKTEIYDKLIQLNKDRNRER